MAQNKKSFVLYSDMLELIQDLPFEDAGKLFKLILCYVNDENPEPDSLLLKIAFGPIKQQLKRDLRKYEEKKLQWSDAGKKSAQARKLKKEQDSTNVNERSTDVKNVATDSTVTVNDTVNDSVNDSENVTGNGTKKSKAKILSNLLHDDFPLEFQNDDFYKAWFIWLDFRKKEYRKTYKTKQSEQMALSKLQKLANGDIFAAGKIIAQSMENQWQGLFELKQGLTTKTVKSSEQKDAEFDELLKQKGY